MPDTNLAAAVRPLLVDSRTAAKMLSVSPRTLWGISSPRGPLPTVPIGRSIRYAVSDLEEWIAANRNTAAPAQQEGRSC